MDSKKSNKIREIVRLQQILKKWKKIAIAPKNNNNNNNTPAITNSSTTTTTITTITTTTTTPSSNGNRGIKFLKRTLSFTDVSAANHHQTDVVPKGFLAICVGKELKRFIIPTEYLGHQAFQFLLREAEEEFGFHQAGVLRIPCEVSLFEKILKLVEEKREVFFLHEFGAENINHDTAGSCSSPSDCELTPSHHPQLCR